LSRSRWGGTGGTTAPAGVTALVGRYIGQGDIGAAKRRAYMAMACAAAYMTLMGVIFLVFRRPLIALFRPEPEVIAAGSAILIYVAVFQFADAVGILSSGALKGAGDTKFPAIAQVVIAWFFFLPLVFYFGRADVWGLHGAWLTATVYIWIYDIVLFWRFLSERWRKINVFA
jgi:MATE family multidrug resistance protein